uniref:histidine kinase n=1 Tax=Candidatus Kentrum sp. MB TaxID=2138164 RepID=A0A450XNI1_9GAMM|nr:MAG: Signal transduction histidine kinase [Candidatus Kentron sp. MB]
MGKHRNRKNPKWNKGGQERQPRSRKNPEQQLEDVNKLKEQILTYLQQDKPARAEQLLGYLRENYQHRPDLLAKSLCDLAKQIPQPDWELALYREAVDCNAMDTVALTSYATALANAGRTERAFELFQRSLELKDTETVTLNSYATALANAGQSERAFELFQRSLELKDTETVTLNSYATALANAGQSERAFELFQRSLELKDTETVTLNSYATALANAGQSERAFELFQRSLELKDTETVTLNSYATALANAGQNERAFGLFQRSLEIKEDDIVLNSYATALANAGQSERAFELFERSLELKDTDTVTLTSYATALANAGRTERAFELFQRSLEIKDTEPVTLTSYATALANAGQNERAFGLFQRSLEIKEDDIVLNSYATALANAGRTERAFELFERSLSIKPDDEITLLQFGLFLETRDRYLDAIEHLERIPLAKTDRSAGFVCLNLGRLYYRNHQRGKATEWFERAMEYSDNVIASKLYATRDILTLRPYSKEAVALLEEIIEEMPGHGPARQMLRLNLGLKEQYERFGAEDEEDEGRERELLNRGIYHKINNEIAILKAIVYSLAGETESEVLARVIESIETISEEISRRRNTARMEQEARSPADYEQVLRQIADTAQDISDFVNNEIAIIKQDIYELLYSQENITPPDDERTSEIQRLLEQIEFTEGALNDLKTVNESIRLHIAAFPVRNLFANWERVSSLGNAAITVETDNPDAVFHGDEQKIKAILKELVDNTLKHNPHKSALRIRFRSWDREALPNYLLPGKKLPGQRRYLHIEYLDDGEGIPEKQKEWVFQPLKTTTRDGSGLGLFIVRKTVRAMRGYILERGSTESGARFEIYLPYGAEQ